jgi:hypothetical protein
MEARSARRPWGNDSICNDLHDHPVHAEWLGCGGRVPGQAGGMPFLMKDIVLLAVSIYPVKQDVVRMSLHNDKIDMTLRQPASAASRKSDCKSDLPPHVC